MWHANRVGFSRDCDPYTVKVVVPTGAWAYLDDIHKFHLRNGIAERCFCYRTDDGDVLQWHFPEPAYAEFFIAEFGGELMLSPFDR